MLGRPIAETLLPEFAEEPSLEQLAALMRCVQDEEPDLLDTVVAVTATSTYAERLAAEAQLDALADQAPSNWKHPAQVLARPRKPFQQLLILCQQRLERFDGTHGKRRLQSVARKLQRTIQLEATARRRREQVQTRLSGFETHREDAQRRTTKL